MVFGSMLPPVYAAAHELSVKLHRLGETRTQIEHKTEQARAEEHALNAARATLAALQVRRTQEAARANLRLGELHAVTEDIAKSANDLKSLIDRIAQVRTGGTAAHGMVVVTADNADEDARHHGSLRQPISGIMARGDSSGPISGAAAEDAPGVWFTGSGGGQVVAPADGEIVFAGPYQKFGQVLILELTGGYDLVLAGLGRIDVQIGDSTLAGEPLGVLTGGRAARLYMELRRGRETVNVAPWMSAELRRARGS